MDEQTTITLTQEAFLSEMTELLRLLRVQGSANQLNAVNAQEIRTLLDNIAQELSLVHMNTTPRVRVTCGKCLFNIKEIKQLTGIYEIQCVNCKQPAILDPCDKETIHEGALFG